MTNSELVEVLTNLGYYVGYSDEGILYVEGFGISLYIKDDDTETLTNLADLASHAEREFQYDNPDAFTARNELEKKGYTVTRFDPTINTFDIYNSSTEVIGSLNPSQLIEQSTLLPQL